MSQVEEYISIAREFIQEIEVISKTRRPDNANVLSILSSLSLDDGWNLGIRFAEYEDYGDKSWFYCYQGDRDTYIEDYRKRVEAGNDRGLNYFFQCESYAPVYELFNHLRVECSPMGAWQAYLLSEAPSLLPSIWHGAYHARDFVFCKDDIHFWLFMKDVKKAEVVDDFALSVELEGNTATITCYYWNYHRGFFQDTAKLNISDGKVSFSKNRDEKLIYKTRLDWML